MSDFNSSLPIRTQTDGDVVAKIVDKDGVNKAIVNASNELTTKDADVETAVTAVNTTLTNSSQKTKVTDGTDDLAVNSDGSINVRVQEEGVSGTEKHVYATVAAGVPNTPSTVVDYTVTAGKTFRIRKFQASGSGKAKVELKTGPAASETVKVTAFTSSSDPNYQDTLPSPIEVAAGEKILIVVTNKDAANQDLYAYISGNEI